MNPGVVKIFSVTDLQRLSESALAQGRPASLPYIEGVTLIAPWGGRDGAIARVTPQSITTIAGFEGEVVQTFSATGASLHVQQGFTLQTSLTASAGMINAVATSQSKGDKKATVLEL